MPRRSRSPRPDPPIEGDDKPALRKFSMVAYTGGAMRLGRVGLIPVVVDLAGLRVTRKSRPILKDHDRGSISWTHRRHQDQRSIA